MQPGGPAWTAVTSPGCLTVAPATPSLYPDSSVAKDSWASGRCTASPTRPDSPHRARSWELSVSKVCLQETLMTDTNPSNLLSECHGNFTIQRRNDSFTFSKFDQKLFSDVSSNISAHINKHIFIKKSKPVSRCIKHEMLPIHLIFYLKSVIYSCYNKKLY